MIGLYMLSVVINVDRHSIRRRSESETMDYNLLRQNAHFHRDRLAKKYFICHLLAISSEFDQI